MRRKQHPADQHARKLARRERKRIERASLVMLALAACGGAGAARAEEPASLDDQLRSQLGLGTGTCAMLATGDPGGSFDLDTVDFGASLKAICRASAVSSASSLGGGLSDFQATKTVSQFRLARRRIDARLRRGGRRTDWDGVQLAFASPNADIASLAAPAEQEPNVWSLFGELEGESKEREGTRFEQGYDSDAVGVTLGVDRRWSGQAVGVWVSYSDMDGDYEPGQAVIAAGAGAPPDTAEDVLDNRAALESVCGGPVGGGGFSNEALTLGAFWGVRFGDTGFADVNVSFGDRDYDYSRSVCTIELPNDTAPLSVENGFLFANSSSGAPINSGGLLDGGDRVADDVFSGVIDGATSITEYAISVRTGFDHPVGGWILGPRAALSYAHTEIDAFTEHGSTYRARAITGLASYNDVVFCLDADASTDCPDGASIIAAGDPTGLELAYEDQDRSSLLLEIGAEFSRPIEMSWGVLAPHGSVTLRHEFEDDRELVTVRMAQDNRGANATRFAFATDAPDTDDIVLSAGLTALVGMKMAADLEVTHLAANELYESTAVSAQFRVRF